MKLEISVSHRGTHVFTTDHHSGNTPEKVKLLLSVFKKKFPKSEGFKISVSLDRQEFEYYADANEYLRKHYAGPHYED